MTVSPHPGRLDLHLCGAHVVARPQREGRVPKVRERARSYDRSLHLPPARCNGYLAPADGGRPPWPPRIRPGAPALREPLCSGPPGPGRAPPRVRTAAAGRAGPGPRGAGRTRRVAPVPLGRRRRDPGDAPRSDRALGPREVRLALANGPPRRQKPRPPG